MEGAAEVQATCGCVTPSGKKLLVAYHCCLTNAEPVISIDHTIPLMSSQMSALVQSGLADAADEIIVGSSNGEANGLAARMMAPAKATVVDHAPDTVAELPTLALLQDWCNRNPDGYAMYHHTKGATYPGNAMWNAWRRCMENVVVWNWRSCAKDLDQGFDCAGPHWLTPQQYPFIGNVSYFAGTFWWATAKHISRLPKIDVRANRFEAEVWVGKARNIKARGYENHFPMSGCR